MSVPLTFRIEMASLSDERAIYTADFPDGIITANISREQWKMGGRPTDVFLVVTDQPPAALIDMPPAIVNVPTEEQVGVMLSMYTEKTWSARDVRGAILRILNRGTL